MVLDILCVYVTIFTYDKAQVMYYYYKVVTIILATLNINFKYLVSSLQFKQNELFKINNRHAILNMEKRLIAF